jgi:outer membrane lipopolysaccharide assembly protein LptE/RlpB
LRVATSHSQVSFFNSNGRQISKSPTLTHLKSEKSHNEFDRYFNKQLDKVNTSLFKEEQQKPKKILRIETSPRKTSPTTRERPQTTTSKPLQEKL